MSETSTLAEPVPSRSAGTLSRPKRPNVVGKFGFELAEPPSKDKDKDVLIPVLAKLSERYLAKARDENELDMVFRSALARHPKIPASLIEKFVEDFNYIPTQVKDAHFAMSVLAGPAGAPLDINKVAKTAAGRDIPRPWGIIPKIESFSPSQPRYGYVPGQQITAIGQFFGEAGHNAVEIWMLDPDNPHKVYDIRPVREDVGHLTFSLPSDITPGVWHLCAVTDAEYKSDLLVLKVAAPGIVVTSIENAGQQPGTDIIITGQNFKPDTSYKIIFTSMDIPPPESAPTVVEARSLPAQPSTQIIARIPGNVFTGNNQVQVSSRDEVTPPSNVLGYVVGVPQYHLTFLKMRCLDETDWGGTEWGNDEVKTVWTVVADGAAWTARTKEYSLDEGEEQSYTPEDGGCAFKDGQFGEIRYGLAIITGLYETEGDDIATCQDYLDVAGQVGAAIVSAVGYGPAASAAVKAVSAGLAKLVKWIFDDTVTVGYDGSHSADHPGPINMYWSALNLQTQQLPKRNTETGIRTLDMHGDDDHGWYQVTYKIARN